MSSDSSNSLPPKHPLTGAQLPQFYAFPASFVCQPIVVPMGIGFSAIPLMMRVPILFPTNPLQFQQPFPHGLHPIDAAELTAPQSAHTLAFQSTTMQKIKKEETRKNSPRYHLKALKKQYAVDPYLSRSQLNLLLDETGLNSQQIQRWFEKERKKQRKSGAQPTKST